MSKKLLLLGLSLTVTVLLATSGFGQACSSTPVVHYVGIGSSAQFNTLAYGANDALSHLATYTAPTTVWSSKSAQVIDTRLLVNGANPIDAGLSIWVLFDSSAACNVYVGYQADSVQGVKDYFAYAKAPTGFVGVRAATFGHSTGAGSWETLACVNVVPGLPCSPAGNVLPAAISGFLVTQPTPVKVGGVQQLPPAYCGQTHNTAGKVGTNTAYCYFNAGHTDIRPEDALFASTRALSSYNTTNSMYGLGYDNPACGGVASGSKSVGCPIQDSFNKGKIFYPLGFVIKGADPYTAAAPVPSGTTLTLGAAPLVVLVNNADSADSLGFGVVQQDGSYLHKDVLHKVLAHIFEGSDSCTGDLIPTTPTPSAFGGTIPGSGQPIQVVLREPLSGTYNAFEFTAVRTFSGSGLTAASSAGTMVGLNKVGVQTTKVDDGWVSDQEASQELDVRNELPAGPATGWSGGVAGANCTQPLAGTGPCGNPLYYPTGSPTTSGAGCGRGLKLRAIGTGEEVAATLGSDNVGAAQVKDGIGYSFWGYSNFSPTALGCTGSGTSGNVACSSYIGHYLTVDAIDPLFAEEGGGTANSSGPYNLPQCGFIQKVAGYTFPCEQIPFTHIYDGKYPLWSFLRIVSMANVAATATLGGSETPEGVINVVGFAQTEAAPGSAEQLSDFVPFLSGLTGLPYTQGGTAPTGNLNLGVFRSHYQQPQSATGVAADNGHDGCAAGGFNFTAVALQGGTPGNPTCLVDSGGDMGGSVLTVQSDVDFILDLGGLALPPVTFPKEYHNLHQ